MRRDGHANLIGDRETATSLKAFFGKKNLNVTKQFRAVARRQSAEKYNVALNQRQPFFRKRPGSQPPSPALSQERKDHSATLIAHLGGARLPSSLCRQQNSVSP